MTFVSCDLYRVNHHIERIWPCRTLRRWVCLFDANNVSNKQRLDFKLADFSSFETKEFDVVVSNPPYVNKNEIYNMQFDVTKHEPYEAIFADEEGLIWYKKIIQN